MEILGRWRRSSCLLVWLVRSERLGAGALCRRAPDAIRSRSPRSNCWNFRYAGPDENLAARSLSVSASTENPVGLDSTDPREGRHVCPVAAVPWGAKLSSPPFADVTHSFFVRELRLKQDAVPGMEIHIHFTANVPAIMSSCASNFAG